MIIFYDKKGKEHFCVADDEVEIFRKNNEDLELIEFPNYAEFKEFLANEDE